MYCVLQEQVCFLDLRHWLFPVVV